MAKMQTCRVISITKDKLSFCSSKVIRAELVNEECGTKFTVDWAHSPTVVSSGSVNVSRKVEDFEQAWDCVKEGDMVLLFYGRDRSNNYFTPLKT